MRPGPHDVSFTLFGFSTTIQPIFWLIAFVITAFYLGPIVNMPFWLLQLLFGMAGVFLSIFVHELGHALVFRYVFRAPCAIVFHGFGGMAIPLQYVSRSYGVRGMMQNIFLSFAGPGAGFLLAFGMIALIPLLPAGNAGLSLLYFFIEWVAVISIFWGIFNLLPIYPMDGGHISREMFSFFFPRQGVHYSLNLSMLCAVLLAALAILNRQIVIAILLGYFAYMNYQEMTFGSFRR